MNHLTDSQLNEYLDHTLDLAARRAVQAHLQACDDCRVRLEEIQFVFSGLANLPEARLPRDLTSSVLVRLPKRQTRVWSPAFAAQLGAALGASLWLSMEIAKFALPLPSAFQLSQVALPDLRAAIPDLPLPTLDFLFTIPDLRSWIPEIKLPAIDLSLSAFNITFLVTAALALWVIGNITLLRGRIEVRK
jgi:hypothetical protein